MNNGGISPEMSELVPIIMQAVQNGAEVTLTVRGNSMFPFLQNGRDKAVFASLEGRKIRRGDLVLFSRGNGSYVMHRVCGVGESYDFLGDAQWQPECGIPSRQLTAYVPAVVRRGKRINCEKGFWRRVMTAYMLMRMRAPGLARLVYKAIYNIARLIGKTP